MPLALELLADVTLRPRFPADALTWAKRRIVAELQADRDDPAFRADHIFRGLVYGDHPYARDPRGAIREIGRITLDDVKAHHSHYFTADNAFLVLVGDFEPRKLTGLVKANFKGWGMRGGLGVWVDPFIAKDRGAMNGASSLWSG